MRTPPVKSINTVAKRFVGRSELALKRKSIRESLVSLAGLIGKPVKYQGGKEIGRLVDVVVRHGEDSYPPVSGLIIKVGQSKSFIDGARISKLAQNEIELSSAKVDLTEFTRREGESLLEADVLDHQMVDVNGLRVVRSSDLYLAPLDREIRVVGVDISFKAFIRRIFPGALGRGPIPKHVIDWANVASLAHGTGVVKSTESRAALGQLRPADLADLIEDLAGRERNALIEMLDPDLAADALEEMEDEELQGLLRGLSAQRSAELVSRMEPDEGAEVLRDLDDNHRESILLEMDVSVAKQLRKLVEFDETLAGGIMTSHMLITHEDDTVASALALLVDHKGRDISDGIVVVDARGKLLDHIQIIELIAAKPSAKLSSLMGPPAPTTVNLNTRLDEVIDEFANNRGSSIIVVDEKNKPVGRILADDLVDALASTSDTQGFSQGSGAL
jgi:CBS domain-containing protein